MKWKSAIWISLAVLVGCGGSSSLGVSSPPSNSRPRQSLPSLSACASLAKKRAAIREVRHLYCVATQCPDDNDIPLECVVDISEKCVFVIRDTIVSDWTRFRPPE